MREIESSEAVVYVRENWLTRPLNSSQALLSAWATITLFITSLMYWHKDLSLGPWMSANGAQVFEQHQYWRLWTTALVHADMGHLFSNALLFFVLGIFISGYFGALIFPLAALFFGGVVNFFTLQTMPPATNLIGASGIVYWMGGFWLTLYLLLETRRSLGQRWIRAMGVALGIFMPTETFSAHISYLSHALGFLFGVGFGFLYYILRRRRFMAAEVRETVVEGQFSREESSISPNYSEAL